VITSLKKIKLHEVTTSLLSNPHSAYDTIQKYSTTVRRSDGN
jgi:hypothetical protein